MLLAGFAKIDMTPDGPVPLGGYVTRGDRMSEKVGDPLTARALYLEQDGECACVVGSDLLLIHGGVYDEVHRLLSEKGRPDLRCFLHAQHTHSSLGGYWDNFPARGFLGGYRPELFERITKALADAAFEASKNPRPATVSFATGEVPGLNENRRDIKGGPVDPEMTVVDVAFEDGDAVRIVSYPGHPVVASEKDNHRLSADYPGALCAKLETKYTGAMYVNGAVGATSIAFPPEIEDCDEHLEFVSRSLFDAAERIGSEATRIPAGARLINQVEWIDRPPVRIKALPGRWRVRNLLARPLTFALERMFASAMDRQSFPLHNVALGPLVFCGQPSDAGVSLSLAIQEYGKSIGFAKVLVVSQVNDYTGYVHLPHDYDLSPFGREEPFMVVYENCMGFFGHRFGQSILDKEKTLLAELKGLSADGRA